MARRKLFGPFVLREANRSRRLSTGALICAALNTQLFAIRSTWRAHTKCALEKGRVRVSTDDLQRVVEKVGDSISAVTKEIELERMPATLQADEPSFGRRSQTGGPAL